MSFLKCDLLNNKLKYLGICLLLTIIKRKKIFKISKNNLKTKSKKIITKILRLKYMRYIF